MNTRVKKSGISNINKVKRPLNKISKTSGAKSDNSVALKTIIKQSRKSGVLNLSGRYLEESE